MSSDWNIIGSRFKHRTWFLSARRDGYHILMVIGCGKWIEDFANSSPRDCDGMHDARRDDYLLKLASIYIYIYIHII